MPSRPSNRRAKLLAAAIAANSSRRRARSSVPRPPVRRAPQPRRGGGQVVRARNPIPRGLSPSHHFNAFGPQVPQALAFSVGPATQISGAVRFKIALDTTDKYTLLAFQPGGGLNQVVWTTESASWASGGAAGITSTGITGTPSASSPDTIMASRGSLRIRNLTAAGKVAGAVHFLRASTGLSNFYDTPADSAGIYELIMQNARTVTMSGSQLTLTHQWDCIPVSQDKYHEFAAPTITRTGPLLDPGLTTILVLIEHQSSDAQTYEFSVAATYYARYRFIGPLANSAVPPPTLNLDVINRLRSGVEAVGSFGKPVAMAAMSALRDAASEAVPGMLGNMVRQNMGFPQFARPMLALPAL